jgi:hypothetical protein
MKYCWATESRSLPEEVDMFNPTKYVFMLFVMLTSLPSLAADLSEVSLRAADAEQMRIIVDEDANAQNEFMHQNYMINAPSNRILKKPALVDMLAKGKMASETFERLIEATAITGNIGIVMGEEIVTPGAGSELFHRHGDRPLNRRFTNVFIFENGKWYFLARQASIVEGPAE